jgi:MoaA/NifB/PqqE/SkfB family radical SAM enzyme
MLLLVISTLCIKVVMDKRSVQFIKGMPMPSLYKLYIELTRKCNLTCAHCLKGCAQNKDISEEYLYKAFYLFNKMDWLVLGGGEPFLNLKGIYETVHQIIDQNVKVNHIFISTNGCCENIDTNDVMDLLLQLKSLCRDSLILQLSNTQYHKDSKSEQQHACYQYFKDKLYEYKIQYIEYNHIKEIDLVPEGNAKNNLLSSCFFHNIPVNQITALCKDTVLIEFIKDGLLYITCDGDVAVDCHSYENIPDFTIASLDEFVESVYPGKLLLDRLAESNLIQYKDYVDFLHEKEIEELVEIWYTPNHG